MNHDLADRPEWRTALIAKELARYEVQMAALSETWLAEEGILAEIGTDYTFFWIGCSKHNHPEVGVGFPI